MVVLAPGAHEAAQLLMGLEDEDDVDSAHRRLPGFTGLRPQASAFKPLC